MQEDKIENGHLDILKQIFHEVPFNKTLGLKLHTLTPHETSIHFASRDEHIGNFLHGILHGGVISAILDAAGGVVAMASIIHKHPKTTNPTELAALIGKCSTIDLHINYLRPGRGETFIAKAYMVKSGSKIIFMRMELINQDNELIASGTGTYLW